MSTAVATVTVQPLTHADGDRLRAFHARLSRETLHFRYFHFKGDLSDADVERLTGVDQQDRVAFAAIEGDRLIGIGRYDVLPGTTDAEMAFVVQDDWQGQGVGTLLLGRLVDRARETGITCLLADTLADNSRMLTLFHHAGLPYEMHWAAGCVRVALTIRSHP